MTPERTEVIRAALKQQDALRSEAAHASEILAEYRDRRIVSAGQYGIRFGVRMQEELIAFLDRWREQAIAAADAFQIPPEGSP